MNFSRDRRLLVCLMLATCASGECGSLASAGETDLNGFRFTLPDGFEIELVAGPGLVNRPICADFDEQGRLYIGDSSGSNENVKIQLQKERKATMGGSLKLLPHAHSDPPGNSNASNESGFMVALYPGSVGGM